MNKLSKDLHSLRIFGTKIHPLALNPIIQNIGWLISQNSKSLVANHNLNSLYWWKKDSDVQKFYSQTTFNFIDGMPLVLMSWLSGHSVCREQRVTWIDLIHPLLKEAEISGWSVFHLGGEKDTAVDLRSFINTQYPDLVFTSHHGFFDRKESSTEQKSIVTLLNNFKPTLLLVGLGTPLGEKWILENFKSLEANVIMPVGGLASYLTGRVATPPRWSGRWGLEWFFRFLAEPKRLFKRYFVEAWSVLFSFFIQEIRKNISAPLKESPELGS